MSPRNIAKLRRLWKLYQDCQTVWARQHGPMQQVLHQLNLTVLELIEMQLEELDICGPRRVNGDPIVDWQKAVHMSDKELIPL